MSVNEEFDAKSVGGIKLRAKKLKRVRGIPHMQALDEVSIQAGFNNWRHAQRALSDAPRASAHASEPLRPVYLSATYRDRGMLRCDVLPLPTRVAWGAEIAPGQLRTARGLRVFRIDAEDHFEHRGSYLRDAVIARQVLRIAARDLQFMEASGLRPWKGSLAAFRPLSAVPHRDHPSYWMDTATGAKVFVDEPYGKPDELLAARDAWARERGLVVRYSVWPGIHSPGLSRLMFTAEAAHERVLDAIVARLAITPAPMADDAEWTGETVPGTPGFVSPARRASGREKRPRPIRLLKGTRRKGAVLLAQTDGDAAEWRPDAKLPIKVHQQLADLVNALLLSRAAVTRQSQLSGIRYRLEQWLEAEYPDEANTYGSVVDGLYRDRGHQRASTAPQQDLEKLVQLLRQSYPDSSPLRAVLKSLAVTGTHIASRV